MVQDSNIRPLALQPPDQSFQIRPVLPDDIDALYVDCWAHRTRLNCRELIRRVKSAEARRHGLGIVVLSENPALPIIGYGQLLYWGHCAEISDLMVSAQYRSQGIGTAIIQYLVQYARVKRMGCVEIGAALSNPRALVLYQRLGFQESYSLLLQITTEKEPVQYLRLLLEDE